MTIPDPPEQSQSDPFARPHGEPPVGDHYFPEKAHQSATAHGLFQPRPRLVPMWLLGMVPVYVVVAVIYIDRTVAAKLKEVDDSGFVWQLSMTLIAVMPGVAVCLMPVVQRRHLTRPEPFYTYCRRLTLMIAMGYPPLSLITWLLGPADPVHYVFLYYLIFGMYVTFMSLFPWAARLNHAAWLRAGGDGAGRP